MTVHGSTTFCVVSGKTAALKIAGARDETRGQTGSSNYPDGSNLSLPKKLSGANAFEISDIERMNIGAHQLGI
jgi:hypothetical protein